MAIRVWMDHIVYLDKPAGALEAMRRGDKTMVARAYNGRRDRKSVV